ncbi:MAG: hypothetical protein RL591_1438 [Planctomycetota bacterium]
MSASNEFYVGYLPTPARQRRFLLVFLPVCALLAFALAAFVGAFARPTGDGVWDTGHEVTMEGELLATPFPMLRVVRADGAIERVLLVEMGKHGADARVAPLVPTDGTRVAAQARGFLIARGGQRMLELVEEKPITLGGTLPARVDARAIGTVEISGEIVDSKCWLGVMKPGDGKAHRDCATLCIRGGIPPSIICEAPDGTERRALVVGRDGTPLAFDSLAPWIAAPVVIRGNAEVVDGMAIVRVEQIARADELLVATEHAR